MPLGEKTINILFWDILNNSTTSRAMSSIHDPRYIQLIDRLIQIRELKNVTQVELASCLKKPQSYVAKIENLEAGIQ